MVGSDVFPIGNSPFLGDMLVLGGVIVHEVWLGSLLS